MWHTWKNFHEKFHERIDEMQKCRGLRMWILHILYEHGPKNGVEIMDAVATHYEGIEHMRNEYHKMRNEFGHHHHKHHHSKSGPKRPSPGSVYPMLKKMVDEDLIIKREDGRYELTEKGHNTIQKLFGHPFFRPHGKPVDQGALAIENILTELDGQISYLEDIKKEKLIPYEESIGMLGIKLRKLIESLDEK
jgi:DNA-binding PadR family transcriptional regulator